MAANLALWFVAAERVEVRPEPCPEPGPEEVRVRTRVSAISPGTELLLYRGQMPEDLAADETLPALQGRLAYPLKYGYAAVGQVEALGARVASDWLGRRVFAFQPHQACFVARPDELFPIPDDVPDEDAVFLPNMETAVNFVMDGTPVIGERVVVLGQGVVGLLTTALLSRFPLEVLLTYDRYPLRRAWSKRLGAHTSLDPDAADALAQGRARLAPRGAYDGADLVYEVSGAPEALNMALALAGFAGRVVIGSWYGTKRANLDLGGRFHRSRVRLLSSQVSTLDPRWLGRWDKARRFAVAWRMLREVQPSRLVTHRVPIQQAQTAYRWLAERPNEALQVLLTYPQAD